MNDRASDTPPSKFTRTPRRHDAEHAAGREHGAREALMERLMEKYMVDTMPSRNTVSVNDTPAAAPRERPKTAVPDSVATRPSTDIKLGSSNTDIAKQTDKGGANGGVFRFGKALSSAFAPVWGGLSRLWEGEVRKTMVAEQRAREKQEAKRLAKQDRVQHLKANKAVEQQKVYGIIERKDSHIWGTLKGRYGGSTLKSKGKMLHRDSGVEMDDYQEQFDRRDLDLDLGVNLATDYTLLPPPKEDEEFGQPLGMEDESILEASSHALLTDQGIRKKKSFGFLRPSMNNLKKVRSEMSLSSSTNRPSTAPAPERHNYDSPPTMLVGDNFVGNAHALHKSVSKKDLQKQAKLSKRVSDLETQLEKARKELALSSSENTFMFAPVISSADGGRPSLDSRSVPRKKKHFVSSLPTLPSDNNLMGFDFGDREMSEDSQRPDSDVASFDQTFSQRTPGGSALSTAVLNEAPSDGLTLGMKAFIEDGDFAGQEQQQQQQQQDAEKPLPPLPVKKLTVKRLPVKKKCTGSGLPWLKLDSGNDEEAAEDARTPKRKRADSATSARCASPKRVRGTSSSTIISSSAATKTSAQAGKERAEPPGDKANEQRPTSSNSRTSIETIRPLAKALDPITEDQESATAASCVARSGTTTTTVALSDEPGRPTATATPARPHAAASDRPAGPRQPPSKIPSPRHSLAAERRSSTDEVWEEDRVGHAMAATWDAGGAVGVDQSSEVEDELTAAPPGSATRRLCETMSPVSVSFWDDAAAIGTTALEIGDGGNGRVPSTTTSRGIAKSKRDGTTTKKNGVVKRISDYTTTAKAKPKAPNANSIADMLARFDDSPDSDRIVMLRPGVGSVPDLPATLRPPPHREQEQEADDEGRKTWTSPGKERSMAVMKENAPLPHPAPLAATATSSEDWKWDEDIF